MKIRIEATQKLYTYVDVDVPDVIVKDNAIDAWINENVENDTFDWKDQDSAFDVDTWEVL
jgi:hypothetical protein